MGPKMADQAQRNASGQFIKGHKGLKKKGAKHRLKDIKTEALALAKDIGGKQGLAGFLRDNPKLHSDLVLAAARDKAAAVDAAGHPVGPAVYHNELNILIVPSGMCAIPDSLGGGYCCVELVRFLHAAAKARTLGPFDRSANVDVAEDDPPLTTVVPFRVPAADAVDDPGVIPFPRHHRDDDNGGVPPAA
jgi:hypothetical protein